MEGITPQASNTREFLPGYESTIHLLDPTTRAYLAKAMQSLPSEDVFTPSKLPEMTDTEEKKETHGLFDRIKTRIRSITEPLHQFITSRWGIAAGGTLVAGFGVLAYKLGSFTRALKWAALLPVASTGYLLAKGTQKAGRHLREDNNPLADAFSPSDSVGKD